jgi:hypothetical protein
VKHAAFHGDDTGGILSTMLQQLQAVIKQLINGLVRVNADDATHDERL